MKLIDFFVVLINYVLLKCEHASTVSNHVGLNLSVEEKKSLVIFEALFTRKRTDQIEAVNNMMQFKYEDKYKMLLLMLEKAFETMTANKAIIENSDYIPGYSIPTNDTVRDALYQLLDNTAMYGEFQLKLPDITDRIIKQHPYWLVLIKWAIGFTNSTGLFDGKTEELINLVAQDMELIEKSPSFVNPYRLEKSIPEVVSYDGQKLKKKKSKSSKGPRISKPRHTEF